MDQKPTRRLAPFLAGGLAPLAVAGGFLALGGEAVLERIQDLGTIGAVVGVAVFVLTVVLPCGILGIAGRSRGPVAALVRGLILPLGILALSGAARLDGRKEIPLLPPTQADVLAEALRLVWTPGAGLAASPSVAREDSPRDGATTEALVKLRDEVRDLRRERNILRRQLRQIEGAAVIAPPSEEAARRERAEAVEARMRTAEEELARSRESVAGLKGQLRAAETGILESRRTADEMRTAMLKAKEDAQIAIGDAEHEKKGLLAKIEALGESAIRKELAYLKSRAFVPVGVVSAIQEATRGRGLAIRTGGDASRIAGPGLVVSPGGKVLAIIRCGVGKGEALGATVLFFSPVGKVTPGDRVYAHVR